MTRRFRWLLLALVVVGGMALFLDHGQAIWSPLVATERGERTVDTVVAELEAAGLGLAPEERRDTESLTLIGLKEERVLEVWADREDGSVERIRSYPFTAYSGKLGPKLREGDRQIPEGLYEVQYLNPDSSYHLSMRIDYPNEFDRAMGEADDRERLGYDIFLHGRSITIGCIAIGDEAIEDLFLIVAQVGPENTDVIIAPRDFRRQEERPEIEAIDWEDKLYDRIETALEKFTSSSPPPEE